MQEYPNSELLSLAYVKWLMRQQPGKEEVEELLVRLSKSEDTEITFEAQRYLTSFYITSQRFEEAEKAAECVATYVDGMIHAEECLKASPFFGDLGEEIRFISNGALVSLEAFREELFQVMQSPGYMKPLCESGGYRESMEKIQEFLKKA